MKQTERIRSLLAAVLAPAVLDIEDESHRHIGHAGAGGGGHFQVTIVSERFTGLPLVRRHRLVYDALAAEMGSRIHALAITALTPAEWQTRAAKN